MRLSVAILALYPDAGHLVPLLRIGRMLMARHDAAVHCLVPQECVGLTDMFGLPHTVIGHALSPTARHASRQFTSQTILTGSFDVYHYDYYAAIFARCADLVATMLGDLRTRRPDVLFVDNHKFSGIFAGIGAEIDRPVIFHDSTGGLHSRARRLTVNLYGKQLPLWKEAGVIAAGGLYYLTRHAARLYRFRSAGLATAMRSAKSALADLLPRRPRGALSDHAATSAGSPSAASAYMTHHVATGLGLLEHERRGLALHADRKVFGPVLDFPDLPLHDSLQHWLDRQAPRSVTYVSFGSMVTMPPARLRMLSAAFARLGSPVLWVMDHSCALAGQELPPNVRREAVVAQPTALAHPAVGACVTHGGSGTITESLAAGVPMVVMPLMWDQPYNAEFVHELGAGIRRDWWGATDATLARAVHAALHEDSFRSRAAAIARQLREQNGSEKVAALVQSLSSRRPQADAETTSCRARNR